MKIMGKQINIKLPRRGGKAGGETVTLEQQLEREKTRRRWMSAVLLVLLIVLTAFILLWRLGWLAEHTKGHIIETIVVSPEQSTENTVDLCGRLLNSDGSPVVGTEVELHSRVRRDTTDKAGDFYFVDSDYGAHDLYLVQANGSSRCIGSLNLTAVEVINEGADLGYTSDGFWQFNLPTGAQVLEFTLMIDSGGVVTLQEESVSVFTSGSLVYTVAGVASPAEEEGIFTPHGSIMLWDGTILLHVGGARLPDGTYIDADGNLYRDGEQISRAELPQGYAFDPQTGKLTTPIGAELDLDKGVATLPNGVELDTDKRIKYPDGTVVDIGKGTVTTPQGYIIDRNGNVTAPDGTRVDVSRLPTAPNGAGVILPDGTVINADGTITTPGGTMLNAPKGNQAYIGNLTINNPDKKPSSISGGANGADGADGANGANGADGAGGGNTWNYNYTQTNVYPYPYPYPTPSGNGGGGSSQKKDYLYVIDSDTNKKWSQITTIDLFESDKSEVIYPGATGKYNFYIKNGVTGKVQFTMKVTEAAHGAGAIPLEYRLKSKKGYVAGTSNKKTGWLTAEQLGEEIVTLTEKGNVHYTLEWRWQYERGDTAGEVATNDEYDTALGNSANRVHYVKVTINAQAVG